MSDTSSSTHASMYVVIRHVLVMLQNIYPFVCVYKISRKKFVFFLVTMRRKRYYELNLLRDHVNRPDLLLAQAFKWPGNPEN